jgi:CheY-like chemotaxis protein
MTAVMSSRRAPTAPPHPDRPVRTRRRVLFVDDDACILAGVSELLRRAPAAWEIRFALGGEAALELIATARFDVVVCDLSMPRIDGLAVLERVRSRQPDAVRIVLSGGAGPVAALEVTRARTGTSPSPTASATCARRSTAPATCAGCCARRAGGGRPAASWRCRRARACTPTSPS